MVGSSLGLIETHGLAASVEAADAAVKAASVIVSSAEVTERGTTTIAIVGELSSVQAAVEAAAEAADRVGRVLACRVIPRPDDCLKLILARQRFVSAYGATDSRPALAWETSEEAPLTKPPQRPTAPPPATRTDRPARPVTPAQVRRVDRPAPVAAAVQKPRTVLKKAPTVAFSDLEHMAVVKLRQYARTIAALPLKGRQISMANKTQLLAAISSVVKQ